MYKMIEKAAYLHFIIIFFDYYFFFSKWMERRRWGSVELTIE